MHQATELVQFAQFSQASATNLKTRAKLSQNKQQTTNTGGQASPTNRKAMTFKFNIKNADQLNQLKEILKGDFSQLRLSHKKEGKEFKLFAQIKTEISQQELADIMKGIEGGENMAESLKRKFESFTEVLEDSHGKSLIEQLEWGTSDKQLEIQLKKQYFEYTGLKWNH